MTEAAVEKATCVKCEVDVRENTSFCYNCGTPLNGTELVSNEPEAAPRNDKESVENAAVEKPKTALEDLAEKLKLDEESDNKLAKAAAKRKKARVSQRKQLEFKWESNEETHVGLLMAVAGLIALLAGVVVFLTVFWK